jgi:hypothetical protein
MYIVKFLFLFFLCLYLCPFQLLIGMFKFLHDYIMTFYNLNYSSIQPIPLHIWHFIFCLSPVEKSLFHPLLKHLLHLFMGKFTPIIIYRFSKSCIVFMAPASTFLITVLTIRTALFTYMISISHILYYTITF